jgi:cell division protein FtsL
MIKLNVVLFVALVLSCLWLVKTSNEARQLYAAIDRAKSEQVRMDAQFKSLEAEQQHETASLNVSQRAKERLKMVTPSPSNTDYVQDRGPAKLATPPGANR